MSPLAGRASQRGPHGKGGGSRSCADDSGPSTSAAPPAFDWYYDIL